MKSPQKEKKKSKSKEFVVKPTEELPRCDGSDFPLLLKNFHLMNIRDPHFTPSTKGFSPLQRPIDEYLKSGVINLDKTANPSSHEEVAWVKRIIGSEKTGHSGTLDPKVTGCLIVCLDRATRLVKSQQNSGKEYVAVCKLTVPTEKKKLLHTIELFKGALFQLPPLICAVKRQLRSRTIYDLKLIEYEEGSTRAVLWIKCEAGTYIRTLCSNFGMLLKNTAYMEELRRVRSGRMTEYDNLVTLHDLKDAMYMLKNHNDESYIRRVVMPLEVLLLDHKRVMVKDSSIAAISFGAQVMLPGVVRYDNNINIGDEIVIISTKGEAIALAIAQMTTATIATCDHGIVAKLKRVILDRETYDRQWGLGIHAQNAKLNKIEKEIPKVSTKEMNIKEEPVIKKPKLDITKKSPKIVSPKPESDSDSSDSD